jgi:hypothetical protein
MSFPSPSITPPVLADFQISYNGLKMGAGTAYAILGIEGLDLPTVRTGDIARPRTVGEFAGLDLLGGRDITLTLDSASDGVSLQSALTKMAAATVPPPDGQTETPLWVKLPDLPQLVSMCRVRKRAIPIDLAWTTGSFAKSVIVGLHATDPRIYGPSAVSSVALPAFSGGLTFPVTFNVTFGAASPYGSMQVTNSGNINCLPVITITGPVTTPTVTNATTGESLTFYNPLQGAGYTLNAGDTLTIDTDSHEVMFTASGSAVASSRRGWLVSGSQWFDLPPGLSFIDFSSQDPSLPSPAPTCSIAYAPAFVSLT